MSWITRLFGGGDRPEPEAPPPGPAQTHEGFTIRPAPQQASGGWRIGARIEKEVGGTLRRHDLVRADVIADREAAEAASVAKARQMIDEQGERLFD